MQDDQRCYEDWDVFGDRRRWPIVSKTHGLRISLKYRAIEVRHRRLTIREQASLDPLTELAPTGSSFKNVAASVTSE